MGFVSSVRALLLVGLVAVPSSALAQTTPPPPPNPAQVDAEAFVVQQQPRLETLPTTTPTSDNVPGFGGDGAQYHGYADDPDGLRTAGEAALPGSDLATLLGDASAAAGGQTIDQNADWLKSALGVANDPTAAAGLASNSTEQCTSEVQEKEVTETETYICESAQALASSNPSGACHRRYVPTMDTDYIYRCRYTFVAGQAQLQADVRCAAIAREPTGNCTETDRRCVEASTVTNSTFKCVTGSTAVVNQQTCRNTRDTVVDGDPVYICNASWAEGQAALVPDARCQTLAGNPECREESRECTAASTNRTDTYKCVSGSTATVNPATCNAVRRVVTDTDYVYACQSGTTFTNQARTCQQGTSWSSTQNTCVTTRVIQTDQDYTYTCQVGTAHGATTTTCRTGAQHTTTQRTCVAPRVVQVDEDYVYACQVGTGWSTATQSCRTGTQWTPSSGSCNSYRVVVVDEDYVYEGTNTWNGSGWTPDGRLSAIQNAGSVCHKTAYRCTRGSPGEFTDGWCESGYIDSYNTQSCSMTLNVWTVQDQPVTCERALNGTVDAERSCDHMDQTGALAGCAFVSSTRDRFTGNTFERWNCPRESGADWNWGSCDAQRNNGACRQTGSVCTEGGAWRQINGAWIWKDCWRTEVQYSCASRWYTAPSCVAPTGSQIGATECRWNDRDGVCRLTRTYHRAPANDPSGGCHEWTDTFRCENQVGGSGAVLATPRDVVNEYWNDSACRPYMDNANCRHDNAWHAEGAATRNVNGLDVWRDVWTWGNSYTCFNASSVNSCTNMGGCAETASRCASTDRWGTCTAWDKTFSCPVGTAATNCQGYWDGGCWEVGSTCAQNDPQGNCSLWNKLYRCENWKNGAGTHVDTPRDVVGEYIDQAQCQPLQNAGCSYAGYTVHEGAATRTISGLNVWRSEWAYLDQYTCPVSSGVNTCTAVTGCTEVASTCVGTAPGGACSLWDKTYSCPQSFAVNECTPFQNGNCWQTGQMCAQVDSRTGACALNDTAYRCENPVTAGCDFVAYVDRHGDLLADWNRVSVLPAYARQFPTKAAYGSWHWNTYGRNENRSCTPAQPKSTPSDVVNEYWDVSQCNPYTSNPNCSKTKIELLEGAETRNINGVPVWRDSWKYRDTYTCWSSQAVDSCTGQMAGCTQSGSTCGGTGPNGACSLDNKTFSCPVGTTTNTCGAFTAPNCTKQASACAQNNPTTGACALNNDTYRCENAVPPNTPQSTPTDVVSDMWDNSACQTLAAKTNCKARPGTRCVADARDRWVVKPEYQYIPADSCVEQETTYDCETVTPVTDPCKASRTPNCQPAGKVCLQTSIIDGRCLKEETTINCTVQEGVNGCRSEVRQYICENAVVAANPPIGTRYEVKSDVWDNSACQALAAKSNCKQVAAPTCTSSGPLLPGCNFEAYVDRYSDLAAFYASGQGMARGKSKAGFGQFHFTRHGSAEGRDCPPYASECVQQDARYECETVTPVSDPCKAPPECAEASRRCTQTSIIDGRCLQEEVTFNCRTEDGVNGCKSEQRQYSCEEAVAGAAPPDETRTRSTEGKWAYEGTCAQGNDQACTLEERVCVDGPGTRTINGVQVYSECWRDRETYACYNTNGRTTDCEVKPGCVKRADNCLDPECKTVEHVYDCETKRTNQTTRRQCNTRLCVGSLCFNVADEEDGDLPKAFSAMKTAELAGEGYAVDIQIFKGKDFRCRKDILGFRNCCKDSGWGLDIGLAQCDEGEKLLGPKREKKQCHFVGSYCAKDTIFGCRQKAERYCCFESSLARIIHESGRPQLNMPWGTGKSPQCGGFTVEQFQQLDLSNVDLSEFYQEQLNKLTAPNPDGTVNRIQQQIQQLYGSGLPGTGG